MEYIKQIDSFAIKDAIENIGYIKLKVTELSFINKLYDFYIHKEKDSVRNEFYSTIMHPKFEHKKEVNTFLVNSLQKMIEAFLPNYSGLFANYLAKSPLSSHQVGLHQDWTYTDETKYTSVNVWLPLCNTNERNGGLYVVPYSHKLPFAYRYTPFENDLYDVDETNLKRKSLLIETMKGEAIIYDSRLLHYSGRNNSTKERVACAGIFLPAHAPALHYFREKDVLCEYNVDLDFFCKLNPGEKPRDYPNKVFKLKDQKILNNIDNFLSL